MYQTSHARWSAISQRDAAAHCSFIYGVKTTRIYCRPTCTARLARRANVVYYDNISQAQHDGFRACQRCKPDDVAFFGQREEVVVSALESLRNKQNGATMSWSLKELARDVGVTPSYLCRVFKKTMGTTVGEYMRQFEMQTEETVASERLSSSGRVDSGTTSPECGLHGSGSSLGPELSSTPSASEGCWCQPADRLEYNSADVCGDQTHSDALAPSQPRVAGSSSSYLDLSLQQPAPTEESVDMDFDFDEWVWTEGLNLDVWSPNSDTFTRSTPS